MRTATAGLSVNEIAALDRSTTDIAARLAEQMIAANQWETDHPVKAMPVGRRANRH